MRTIKSRSLLFAVLVWGCINPVILAASSAAPPLPRGAVPSPTQLKWHELEFYGFIHFTINTFTDKEWGYGDESPAAFNPTALDARQWARVARDAGMKGLILTAKHHDGFCLWPSRYTGHSVKNSPWKNGKGDVVKDLAAACRHYGLKLGIYLSPWDRNHAAYGTPEYLTYYRNQLRELLTDYGPVFEVWFDGANGGDGFYGGARETRKIDNSTYYDWSNTHQIVRSLQPRAVMFSDAGPDVRWVGNERGVAYETAWMALDRKSLYPGHPDYIKQFSRGQPDASDWVPPEVDVSIRPGWFYHATEDARVKSAADLVEIYYNSVGRSANLLLNLPPDRRGLIHETDVAQLMEMRRILTRTFKTDLARRAKVTATNTRGNARQFSPRKVNDGNSNTYWATDDGVTTASLELAWTTPRRFDQVLLQEHIALGQRVQAWTLEEEVEHVWRQVAAGTTIGYKRMVRFPAVTASRVRLNINQSLAAPTISTMSLFLSSNDEIRPRVEVRGY